MKTQVFGRSKKKASKGGLLVMKEITFVSSPADLRRIAAFLVKTASVMEEHGEKFGHRHLQDEEDLRPFPVGSVDVIVASDQ